MARLDPAVELDGPLFSDPQSRLQRSPPQRHGSVFGAGFRALEQVPL